MLYHARARAFLSTERPFGALVCALSSRSSPTAPNQQDPHVSGESQPISVVAHRDCMEPNNYAPTLGLVELPELGEILRQLGFRVISGENFPVAASAIKTVQDAAAEPGGFPIIVADVHRPGIKAWTQKLARTSPVVIVRTNSTDYITADNAVEVVLPATVAGILTAAGLPVPNDARSGIAFDSEGHISGGAPSAEATSPPAPAPVAVAVAAELPVYVAPAVPVFAQPAAAPVATATPAAAPAAAVPGEPQRAPWDTRAVDSPAAGFTEAPAQAPVDEFERVPQTLFFDTAEVTQPVETGVFAIPGTAPAPAPAFPSPTPEAAPAPASAAPPAPVYVTATETVPAASAPQHFSGPTPAFSPRPTGRRSTEYQAPTAEVAPPAPAYAAPAAPVYVAPVAAPVAPVYVAPVAPVAPPAPVYVAPAAPVAPVYVAPAPVAPVAPPTPVAPPAPTFTQPPAVAAPVYAAPVSAPTLFNAAAASAPTATETHVTPHWAKEVAPATSFPVPTQTAPSTPASFADMLATQVAAPAAEAPAPPAPFQWQVDEPTTNSVAIVNPFTPAPAPVVAAPFTPAPAPVVAAPFTPAPSPTAAALPAAFAPVPSAVTPPAYIPNQATNSFTTETEAAAPSRQKINPDASPCIFTWAYKGGVNKTSLAMQLAHRAADAGLRVWLIDMNRGQGGIRTLLRVADDAPVRSAFDAARLNDPSAAFLLPAQLQEHRPEHLTQMKFGTVLAPPRAESEPHQASYSVYRQIIDRARANGDLVIVDTQTVEANDVSGLIDNVMVPMMTADAHGLAITESGKESVENLYAAFGLYSARGLTRDRQMLAVTRVREFEDRDSLAVERKFHDYAHFLGTTADSLFIKDQFDRGVIVSDDPAVTPLLDAVLRQVTGDPRFDPQTPQKKRMFGGRK
jgi:Mrp family chromosome partitioning ATPase